jgi:hypothetical protein
LANKHAILSETVASGSKRSDTAMTQLYWCGTKSQQEQVLKNGFKSLAKGSSSSSSSSVPYIALHSDPSLALSFYKQDHGQEDDDLMMMMQEEEDVLSSENGTGGEVGLLDDYEDENDVSYKGRSGSGGKRATGRKNGSRGGGGGGGGGGGPAMRDAEGDEIGLVTLVSCNMSKDVVKSCGKVMSYRPKSINDLASHVKKCFNTKSEVDVPNMIEVRYSLDPLSFGGAGAGDDDASASSRNGFESSQNYDDDDDDEEEEDEEDEGGYSEYSGSDHSKMKSKNKNTNKQKEKRQTSSSTEGGFAIFIKTSCLIHELSSRFYPEAHFLVASGSHGMDGKRLDRKLDELSQRSLPYNGNMNNPIIPSGGDNNSGGGGGVSVGSGGLSVGSGGGGGNNAIVVNTSGGVGWNLLDELEVAIEEELSRYSERLWEGVDPQTADKLREADAEVSRKEEALALLRGQIENERQTQETLIRNLQKSAMSSSNLLPNSQFQSQVMPPHAYMGQQQQQQQQPQQQQQQPNSSGNARSHHRSDGRNRSNPRGGGGGDRPKSAANNGFVF